jgi:hypothetical protein
MYKEIKMGKAWVNFGFTLKAFQVGILISKGYISLDLVFIWIVIEF